MENLKLNCDLDTYFKNYASKDQLNPPTIDKHHKSYISVFDIFDKILKETNNLDMARLAVKREIEKSIRY